MIVEEIRVDKENYDKFPEGLRVLAVDDDPICLKLLETLLRKCQYQVTTTSQARMALKMLRDNKDRFDLVISDVHMPDMDGFKLLELVGLEMDLPVIMLSANSDPKLVMKGVTHGACDYLVKPVRIEELRNIWQHVIRRKKFDPKSPNACNDQGNDHPTGGKGHVSSNEVNVDSNGKFTRKRKDEDEESEDNGNESEDPTTQKKPRVVWSIELHRKFVAAVNQLGIEKAVPKRILDMMNVEGLTRENVASHLQKYRLYLKRISHVTTQQANMAAAFGVKDSPFMRMGSLDGLGDFRTLSGTGRFALSPYASGGMLGRLNTPSNVNLRNLAPTPTPNLSNSIMSHGKSHPSILPSSCQNSSLFQGVPSSMDLDQFQQKGVISFNGMDDSRMLTPSNTFTDPAGAAAIGNSNNLFSSTANNPMMLIGGFANQPCNNIAVFNSNSFHPGKSNETWQNAVEPSKMQPSPLLSTDPFHSQMPLNSTRDPHNDPIMASLPVQDSKKIPGRNFAGDAQNTNQGWGENYYGQSPSVLDFGSLNARVTANTHGSQLNRSMSQNSGIFNQKMDMDRNGRLNGGALATHLHQNENGRSTLEPRARSNDSCFLLEQAKVQGGFDNQGFDSLDDLMNAMIKREHDETMPNCDFGFDEYSFEQGI